MSPLRRSLPLFGLLVLLCVPAVWPYLGGDLPRTNDLATHIFRAFELEQLVRAGEYFPRWGPHLVHGYGYPIFNYFAYLSHYLVTLIRFTGVDYLWAYRSAAVAVTLFAGWGAYLLGRDVGGGDRAGLLAAVAYVYSPYLLYTANVRGGLPESLALAVLPVTLWTWRRAALGGWRRLVPAGLAFAALIFSHNGIALQVSPLLLAFAVWSGRARLRQALPALAAVVALGLAVSAFYWLPALAELGFAQVESRFATTGISYASNFTPLRDLFDYPPLPVDSDLLNPPVLRPLPIVALALAGVALILGWRTRDALQKERVFLAVLAAGCAFITLPQAKFIWDAIPLLQRSLWPWRYLGPAALFIALLAATLDLPFVTNRASRIPHSALRNPNWRPIAPMFIVSLFIANALPWLYPPREPIDPPGTVADLARYELPPLLIGTSTNAEYLPRWVRQLPDTAAQRDALLTENDPDRLDLSTLPEGSTFFHTGSNLFWDQYLVNLPQASTLVFRQFYFPGWRLKLGGQPVPVRVTSPHGLIAVDVPAGEHSIMLEFESTPVRTRANILSLIATGIVMSYYVWRITHYALPRAVHGTVRIRHRASHTSQSPVSNPSAALGTSLQFPPLFFAALAICALFILSLFIDSPLRTRGLAPGHRPTGMRQLLDSDLAGELWLHGFTISSDAIPADGETELDLYWQAQHQLGLDYGFNLRLTDAQGRVWNSPEIVRPRDWRFTPGTDFWPPDQYVLDSYVLRPLPGAPPGEYTLHVVAFRNDTLQELATVPVTTLQITAPDRSSYADLPARAAFDGGQLELLDLRFDREQARPGDPLRIDAVWRAADGFAAAGDLVLNLQLGATPAVAYTAPIGGDYPTSQWQPGDVLADQLIVRLPAALAAGEYEWRLQITAPEGGVADGHASGQTLAVEALERTFAEPPLATRLDARVGDHFVLAGLATEAASAAPGETLALELVWQALAESKVPYRVFVHLFDADDRLVSQSDAEPAGWARPTTGWVPGEYVRDRHVLSVPLDAAAGVYSLHAGMFDPATGARLQTASASDGSVMLGVVEISNP